MCGRHSVLNVLYLCPNCYVLYKKEIDVPIVRAKKLKKIITKIKMK